LLFLVSSVAGQCTGCYPNTSGACKQSNTVCYAYQTPGVCPAGTSDCSSSGTQAPATTSKPATTKPPTTTTKPATTTTKPPTTTAPAKCNCISKQELININSQSSYWGNCDSSQPAKANPGGATSSDGYYCSDTYIAKLNEMLCSLNYCYNLAAKQAFIGQVTHETAYFTKFYQPLDNGRGALHMLPSNWDLNVQNIQQQWPNSGAQSQYTANGGVILSDPAYAWLSAGAWFLSTNQVIPGCNKNLFLQSFAETSRCVFGNNPDPGLASRQQAYNFAVQYLKNTSPDTNLGNVCASPAYWSLWGLIIFSLYFALA